MHLILVKLLRNQFLAIEIRRPIGLSRIPSLALPPVALPTYDVVDHEEHLELELQPTSLPFFECFPSFSHTDFEQSGSLVAWRLGIFRKIPVQLRQWHLWPVFDGLELLLGSPDFDEIGHTAVLAPSSERDFIKFLWVTVSDAPLMRFQS